MENFFDSRYNGEYLIKRKEAKRIDSINAYNLYKGQFNPLIIERFLDDNIKPGSIIWEPFAGHGAKNWTIELCEERNIRLIPFDISPDDNRINKADSTLEGPGENIDGVIFHPPYYGSDSFSDLDGELSKKQDIDYFQSIQKTVKIIEQKMKKGSVCVVARTMRIKKKTYNLDLIFSNMFQEIGCEIIDFYSSIPDWVVVLEK